MTIKYFVLKEELFKREISLTAFAKALNVPTPVLSGKGSAFPLEKLDHAIELLNNWSGPRKAKRTLYIQPKDLKPVTKEMLIDSEKEGGDMGSSQANQLVAGPVSTEAIRGCLVHLGWRIEFADERSMVAELVTKGIGHQEFSCSVTWQAQLNNVLVSVRVAKKTNGDRSELACEQQVKRLLQTIKQTCGEPKEQSPPPTGRRWTGEF